ncbi:adenylate/guanylate cyclase domain-containing protein [Parasedimentitalea huanghaiensis]|uniref:Guanylyl cyclase n=1 Tax=Parasedimentitalea huanghaiensis TaxID=2682100 RepID=A0A6L6WD79_9RHOB|nr:adenylate/guanylate cyclase domain-containing protein [Zongyanglinia huanghaiensis]MVO15803.1 guanylyl cyclase [Zongyanglinia huanghaiensis]
MNRRLAAILFYDVVGYSRAMGQDETATLTALKQTYSQIIQPLADYHQGRMIKVMGDGGFMEFTSAVDAVHFAICMQHAIGLANPHQVEGQRLSYRIGINIGDVIADGDDLYGDGVNIAARLEALADPGGICVHQSVREQIRGKLHLDFHDLGEVDVKNIEKPVRASSVEFNHLAAVVAALPAEHQTQAPKASIRWRTAAGLVAGLFILGGSGWWQISVPGPAPTEIERTALPLPDKPSLAVLPFANLSNDPNQEGFADGLTEDLITDLSRISGLFVVARNSTFVYKGQSVNIPLVAEELGVQYVLEGSARRSGDQVRVNAQLIDAATGGHIWAERYDGDVTDIFKVQDAFIRKIAKALAINLTMEEEQEIALGQTSDIEAREVFQTGWESFLEYSAEDNASAVDQFKKALEIDPDYGRAHAALSLAYLRGCQLRWNKPLGLSAGEANAYAIRSLAETTERPSSLANVAASGVNLYNNRYEIAKIDATRAITQDPNDPEAYIAMAWSMVTTGQPELGLELIDRAMRLNPTYPSYYVFAQAMAHYSMGDLEQTAMVLEAALERDPKAEALAIIAAATYARLQRFDEAHAALKLAAPEADQAALGAIAYIYHFPFEWEQRPEMVASVIDGLHLAALPPDKPIEYLLGRLQTGDTSKRRGAALILGLPGLDAADTVPLLITALSDESKAVQGQAAVSLGKIGPAAASALPALAALKEVPIVGRKAQKAIVAISGSAQP